MSNKQDRVEIRNKLVELKNMCTKAVEDLRKISSNGQKLLMKKVQVMMND